MNFFKFTPIQKKEGAPENTKLFLKSFNSNEIPKEQPQIKECRVKEYITQEKSCKVQNISSLSDILHIDHIIRTNMMITTQEDIKEEIDRCKWIKANSTNKIDVKIATTNLITLNYKLLDVENDFGLINYIMLTNPILTEYKHIKGVEKSFIKNNNNDTCKKRKGVLISEYLRIARNYISLKNEPVYINKIVCQCGSFDFDITTEDFYSCSACGAIIELLDNTPNFKDIDRVNMSVRYKYTEEGNFITAMNEFECIQNSTIPEEVFTLLRKEIKSNSITLEALTRKDIYTFLGDNDLSTHYSDVNLLYYSIKGIKSPDLSLYRDTLLANFKLVEKADRDIKELVKMYKNFKINKIISKDFEHQKLPIDNIINGVTVKNLLTASKYSFLQERTSSRSINFILYKLLQKINFPCKKEDLSFLKTSVKIMEHLEWWEIICEYLGWVYTEV